MTVILESDLILHLSCKKGILLYELNGNSNNVIV